MVKVRGFSDGERSRLNLEDTLLRLVIVSQGTTHLRLLEVEGVLLLYRAEEKSILRAVEDIQKLKHQRRRFVNKEDVEETLAHL